MFQFYALRKANSVTDSSEEGTITGRPKNKANTGGGSVDTDGYNTVSATTQTDITSVSNCLQHRHQV